MLYGAIDNSDGYYVNDTQKKHRSRINVVFKIGKEGTPDLEAKFATEAAARGMLNLKGFPTVGGMRCSMYNPMPIEGVKELLKFMDEFKKANPIE